MLTCREVLKMFATVWHPLIGAFMITIMATYLTGVWELSIVHTAQILNVYSGAVAILPLLMQLVFKEDTLGSRFMVLLTRFAYSTGFVVLTMSAPPILSWATNTCTEQEAECIGLVQTVLFYAGLTLVAVADCVHEISPSEYSLSELLTKASDTADEWFEEQYSAYGQAYEPSFCSTFWVALVSRTGLTLVPFVAVVAISDIDTWWIKFSIPALFSMASLLVILLSKAEENHQPPNIMQEFMLRIVSSEEGISPIWLLPICTNFLLLSVVFSMGNTFFIEQATDLDLSFWFFNLPIAALPMLQAATKLVFFVPMELCSLEPLLGTSVSMIFTSLCCITAAKVETRRLGVVSSEGVIDEPDVIISMSICWLIPQFILLGMAEGFSGSCIAKFFKQLPGRASKYSDGIAQSVHGVGVLCGVLSVYIVREIQPSWFQNTINTSRLDNYYWTLAAGTAVNLALFPFGILLYFTSLPEFHRDTLKERFNMLLYWR